MSIVNVKWCHLYLLQVKYTKHTEQAETKEERKQRKYRYLYQVNPCDIVTTSHNIVTQVRMCHGDVISQVNRPIQVHISISIDVYYFHYGSYFHNLSTISNIQSTYTYNIWIKPKSMYNLQSVISINMQGKYIQHLDTESAAFRWPPLPQLGK